jgi:transposase
MVVCRDRSDLYADGIHRGAPQAVQVVDRFHLVHNLRQALEALLINHRAALQAAAIRTAQALLPLSSPVPSALMYRGRCQSSTKGQLRAEAERQRRHAPWVAIYEALHTLHAQGIPVATIARQLGISRPTVYAYLGRDTPPAPRSPQRSGQVLRPYLPYLIHRWREGISDSRQLWREIQAQGYAHSARTVGRFITRLRRAAAAGQAPEAHTSPYTRRQGPSARAVSFALVCPAAKRSLEAQTYVDPRCQVDTGIARAHALMQAFLTMVRERRGADLEAWMAEAVHSGLEALARFARGLREDLAAVTAGLTLAWSNEHVAYCTSSPASWPLKGTDTLTPTAWWNGFWQDEHTGPPIIIARSHNPASAIPAPHSLFAHAQVRCNLRCRAHPRLLQTRQPVLQAVRAAELGDMRGLEG